METYGMTFPELCEYGFVNSILDSDASYQYVAYAICGKSASDADWAVKRINLTTGSVTWAGGTNGKAHVATDLPALFA